MASCGNNVAGQVFSSLLLLILLLHGFANGRAPEAQAARKPQAESEAPKAAPVFSEADAAHLMAEVQQALEGFNQRRFLKLFNAAKMDNFPGFKDQVAEFFEKYESFRFRYHVKQISSEDGIGVLLADAELEMTPAGAAVPAVRKSAQIRIVAAWDGKIWKIVEWSPRVMLN